MTAVLVVGTMRSGTSMVSAALHSLNVTMGKQWMTEPEAEPGKEWSPAGSFVDADFNHVHKELLWHCHLNSGQPYPKPQYLPQLHDLIRQRDKEFPLWGLKDHWLPFTWHEFVSVAKDVKIITTKRHKEESQRSYSDRIGCALNDGIERLEPWFLAVEHLRKTYKGPRIEIDYAAALKDPKGIVQKIAKFIGVRANPQAVSCIKPEYRRYTSA